MTPEEKQAIRFGEWLLSIGIVVNEPIKYRKFIGKDVNNVKDLYDIFIKLDKL